MRWGGLSAPPYGASFHTAAALPTPLALPLPPVSYTHLRAHET
jgi:hypothetical protein